MEVRGGRLAPWLGPVCGERERGVELKGERGGARGGEGRSQRETLEVGDRKLLSNQLMLHFSFPKASNAPRADLRERAHL